MVGITVELWGGKCDSIYPSHTSDLLCPAQFNVSLTDSLINK